MKHRSDIFQQKPDVSSGATCFSFSRLAELIDVLDSAWVPHPEAAGQGWVLLQGTSKNGVDAGYGGIYGFQCEDR